MAYDLALQAQPLSFTTLGRSYPLLPLRGTFAGPISVKGIAPALEVTADLTGAAGRITYAGAADADSIGGFGARGSGTFEELDAAALVGRTTPPSRLAGTYEVDLTGDLLSNLSGLARRASSTAPRWTACAIAGGVARARVRRRASCTSTRSGSRATSARSSRAARSASRVRRRTTRSS